MLIKETEHLREVINYNKKDTQEKITKLNVEIVRELDNKSSRSELKSFEIEITQNIQSFREEIKGFARSLKAYEAELRRFDEVLLQKASKVGYILFDRRFDSVTFQGICHSTTFVLNFDQTSYE